MIKAVIFDMFETLVTLFAGSVYMGKQIAVDIGIAESPLDVIAEINKYNE